MNKLGFTLVEIMIVIAIIGLIAAIAIPNFIRARQNAQGTMCTQWLERINGAKVQVAFAENLAASSTPADSQLISYLGDTSTLTSIDGSTEICPAGGLYSVNSLDSYPTCTLATGPGDHMAE